MQILIDAILPGSLSDEAPPGVVFRRWKGGDVNDATLIREAAQKGYRAVLFYERDSLDQPDLRRIASDVGVALVAVKAVDPIEAKGRVLRNLPRLRKMLADHDCLLVLAREVREHESK